MTKIANRLKSVAKIALQQEWLRTIPAQHVDASLGIGRTLAVDYGYLRTLEEQRCCAASGAPLPWYTYPAIEFLDSVDWSMLDVFEYGSGASSLWWAARCRRLESVEHVPEWFERVQPTLPPNASVVLRTNRDNYITWVNKAGGFDAVVVDGIGEKYARWECCIAALQALRPGGMIILDNSDWLPQSCEFLRRAGFSQIDFNGFSPGNPKPGRTSVFLSGASLPYREHAPAVGGVKENWERPEEDPANFVRVLELAQAALSARTAMA